MAAAAPPGPVLPARPCADRSSTIVALGQPGAVVGVPRCCSRSGWCTSSVEPTWQDAFIFGGYAAMFLPWFLVRADAVLLLHAPRRAVHVSGCDRLRSGGLPERWREPSRYRVRRCDRSSPPPRSLPCGPGGACRSLDHDRRVAPRLAALMDTRRGGPEGRLFVRCDASAVELSSSSPRSATAGSTQHAPAAAAWPYLVPAAESSRCRSRRPRPTARGRPTAVAAWTATTPTLGRRSRARQPT